MVPDEPYLGLTLNPMLYEIRFTTHSKNSPCNVDSVTRLYGHWPCKLLLNFHLWLKLMRLLLKSEKLR